LLNAIAAAGTSTGLSDNGPLSPRVALDRKKPSEERYCSVSGIQRLRYYRYRNTDKSLLQKYFHSPTADLALKFIPSSLAPNAITLIGFSLVLTSTFLCWYYTPKLTEVPTPLLCGMCCCAVFVLLWCGLSYVRVMSMIMLCYVM
jgi:hypothetical protein